jgi:hypothetical protein
VVDFGGFRAGVFPRRIADVPAASSPIRTVATPAIMKARRQPPGSAISQEMAMPPIPAPSGASIVGRLGRICHS